jgi:hypothetical protein
MVIPVAYIAGGALLGGVAVPATIAIAGFSTGGVVAGMSTLISAQANADTIGDRLGSMAAGIQAGIGNVAAGSAFAVLQSAGTMPLFTGALGAAAGGGTVGALEALGAVIEHAPKLTEALEAVADAAGDTVKATGEKAAQAFMNTVPLFKDAVEGALVATGDSMAIARDNAAKAFADAMPVVNEVFNGVVKGAEGAAVNVQENVSKTFGPALKGRL